jgi:hypothetical protein
MSNWLLLNMTNEGGELPLGVVVVRVDAIAYIQHRTNGRTIIQFVGSEDNYIHVQETAAEIDAALLTEMRIPEGGR